MPDVATEVAALEQQVADSAQAAQVAESAAVTATTMADSLTEQVEQASQAAAVAIVDEVHANTEELQWNKERLNNLETMIRETQSMVAPLMATLESLTAAVQLLSNRPSSADSPAPVLPTQNPPSGDADDPAKIPTVNPEPEPQELNKQEKPRRRHRML